MQKSFKTALICGIIITRYRDTSVPSKFYIEVLRWQL